MAKARRKTSTYMRDPPASGVDTLIEGSDTVTIVKAVRECKKEAEDARRERLRRNRVNTDAYMSIQDWSGKIKGQSREFLPKTSIAAERLSAFIKRALVQDDDWFQMTFPDPIRAVFPDIEQRGKALLNHFINTLPDGQNKTCLFSTRITDGIKLGALESLVIAKVYGYRHPERVYTPVERPLSMEEEGLAIGTEEPPTRDVEVEERERWKLCIDLIAPEDYYPDPSGNGLYEIHTSEVDMHVAQERADVGIYDKAVVDRLAEDMHRDTADARSHEKSGHSISTPPSFRKKLVIDEFWGTLLDNDGRVVQRNIFCAIANDKYIIRKPEPNPNWDGESPFVAIPLIRVPLSVWHKALFDEASTLNLALNEVFNLMIDAGMASVWGITQVRPDVILNPEALQGGIPQGTVIAVNSQLPTNAKAIERVTDVHIPAEAFNMYGLLNSEFTQAALSSELSLGQFPDRAVKATEVMEISRSQSATLDSIVGDIENELIEKILRKAFVTIMQYADDLLQEDVVAAIGEEMAVRLQLMGPAERFMLFATKGQFTVSGLTETLSKIRDFQKFAALMQIIMQNPMLANAFMRTFSPEKALRYLMKATNVNPEHIMRTAEEQAKVEAEMQQVQQMQQVMGAPKGQGGRGMMNGAATGGDETAAEINQVGNPLTGLSVGGQ